MGYRIDIDHANCINCGVCMDVCPVEALDMSRPAGPGVEVGSEGGGPLPWMMEHPVQVGECIGCSICIRECPPNVMTLATMKAPTPLVARQGPVERPVVDEGGWVPLSSITREALKPVYDSPFGDLFTWRTRSRPEPWQVWQSMVTDAPASPIAPCQEACPAGTDAGRYVGLVAAGRYDDAYAVAAEVNPFPSVCGWICTAPCEAACRRGTLDEPIAIRTIKRFAVEHGKLPPVPPPATKRSERVAIVGGGPAGMSAAYYLARLGYRVSVMEAMPVPGGMMAIGIPEYRLPRSVLREEIERIVGLGVELRLDTAMGRDFTLGDLEREGFRAVFLATGASKSRRLGVSGDDLRAVIPATRFLKEVNLGENPRLSGPVVVVGGGSTAMDAARSAWRSGADSVTIVYRRGRGDMPAQE
jgi:ferredoxin